MKTVKPFRISETTAKELEYLSKRRRISQADVIALLASAARYGFLMAEVVEACGSRYDIRSFGVQRRSPIAGLLSMNADT